MTSDDDAAVAVRCSGLYKNFGGTQALVDVNLAFANSGVTAIIGPNGAGKTTLLNLLSGFAAPDTGKCFLREYEITGLPPYQIARMGLARTFQHPRLIRRVSVLDNVLLCFPCQPAESLLRAVFDLKRVWERRNQETAMRLLEFVGLVQEGSKAAGELSYGQQKLLSIACCLATDAQLLLLDEPISGVHPWIAGRILDLLLQLRSNGKQIIFIEHDMAAVRKIADAIVVLDHGKVIAHGPPNSVLEKVEIIEAYLS